MQCECVDKWLKSEGELWSDAHLCVDVRDHLAARLVPLSVVGPLLFLLQDAVACGPVLQRELADDLAEASHADFPNAVGRMTQEQQERMKPGAGTTAFRITVVQTVIYSDFIFHTSNV